MHSYIFDYFLSQKKYEKIIAKIETRLTDLGLQGKNCHVGPLKSLKSIVKDEIKNNPKTIVAIGDNNTLSQLINSLDGYETTIGIIPIGANNSLAASFGVDNEDSACNILSARLIETIDVGTINEYYFISQAKIKNQGTIIEINSRYTVESEGFGDITIMNLTTNHKDNKKLEYGSLGIYIKIDKKNILQKEIKPSFIQTNKIIANNLHKHNFILDGAIEIKPPAIFGVKKNALKIIVGKNRTF